MATVEQLYQEILGREADPEGLAFWQKEIGGGGITPEERARFLSEAQKELTGRTAAGNIGQAGYTAKDLFDLYATDFRPDQAALDFWNQKIATMDPESVLNEFLRPKDPRNAPRYTAMMNDPDFIRAGGREGAFIEVPENVLMRDTVKNWFNTYATGFAPDQTALDFWTEKIRTIGEAGALQQFLNPAQGSSAPRYSNMVKDPEWIAATGYTGGNTGGGSGGGSGGGAGGGGSGGTPVRLSPYTSVEQLYREFLGRDPDEGGMKFWTDYFKGDIDMDELAAFQAAASGELASRAPTIIDQWYQTALRRPADPEGRNYWLDQIRKVGFNQAKNAFYTQAVQELLGRTAVNVPSTPTTSVNVPGKDVVGTSLPGGASYQPQTINVGGAGAVTSGGFAAYPYGQTTAAATLGKPAFDVTQYMAQNPVTPYVATPIYGPGQAPFVQNPYVPNPLPTQTGPAPSTVPSTSGLFGPITPPPKG